jgi:hypothetical protein
MASRAPQDELAQLRARIADLEAELSVRETRDRVGEFEPQSPRARTRPRRSRSYVGQDREVNTGWRPGYTVDDMQDTLSATGRVASDVYNTAIDQSGRKLRGAAQASVDQLYSLKDVAAYFITTLPGDILDSVVNAVDRYVDLSSNAVDSFYEGYRENTSTRHRHHHHGTARASRGSYSTTERDSTSGVLWEELRVVSTSPDMGSSVHAVSSITVTFNRDIMPVGRDYSNSITVRLGSTALTGRTVRSGRDALMWTPAAPLSPGAYTVAVSNVGSLVGPLPEDFVFTFTITAPSSSDAGSTGAGSTSSTSTASTPTAAPTSTASTSAAPSTGKS